MNIEELLKRVSASRNLSNNDSITTEDILEAIKKLKVLGSNIKEIPSKDSYIIHAAPAELNSDHINISKAAHQTQGYVNRSMLREQLDWSDERVEKALNELIMEGVVWIDNQDARGENLYWFPGLK